MGYVVQTEDSHLEWREGVHLDKVASMVQEAFSGNEAFRLWAEQTQGHDADVYRLLRFFFGEVSLSGNQRSFTVYKDQKTCPDELDREEKLLRLLAPFLREGGYVHYEGSDGWYFGWEIKGDQAVKQEATLEWRDA